MWDHTRYAVMNDEHATHENMIAGNNIAAEVATQSGLPFNQWPSIHLGAVGTDSDGKPYKYDLDYADASVLDGDGSDWKARSTS